MVPQITVVGILMIVNGALASLIGIFVALMGPLMFSMFQRMPPGPPGAPPPPQGLINMISLMYLMMGTSVLVGGAMNVVGGIRALAYRNRALVITALFFNIIPMLTCYCLPTSLGVMIYGLIVMFQPDVAQAFALAEDGHPLEEIRRRLHPDAWRERRFEHEQRFERERAGDDDTLAEPRPAPKPPPPQSDDGGDEDTFFEKR
jgi:hypothetical protein